MCVWTRFYIQCSEKLNYYNGTMLKNLSVRNVFQIFLFSKLRNFRAVLPKIVTSLPLFFDIKRKRHYYVESCRNLPINVPFFTENAILKNTKYFGKRFKYFFESLQISRCS